MEFLSFNLDFLFYTMSRFSNTLDARRRETKSHRNPERGDCAASEVRSPLAIYYFYFQSSHAQSTESQKLPTTRCRL